MGRGGITTVRRADVPTPLPSRLGSADVTALRHLTATLRTATRAYGAVPTS